MSCALGLTKGLLDIVSALTVNVRKATENKTTTARLTC